MQIQKKCRVARPKLAGVVQPGDAAHAQLSSRKVTGGTATPTPVRPPPQEPHLELSEPVCSWDIKSGLLCFQLRLDILKTHGSIGHQSSLKKEYY